MANNTKKIVLSGILSAMVVLGLFFITILPTGKLSLYALCSFFVSIVIIECNVKAGWIFYGITCLLAIIMIPDKIRIIPYIVFFGIYGIFKFYIEKFNNIILEYILKYIYFNICLVLGLIFLEKTVLGYLTLDSIKLPFTASISLWIIVIVFEIIFLIYDYVYTLFIEYYQQRLKRLLK
jgi:hypothetical protein